MKKKKLPAKKKAGKVAKKAKPKKQKSIKRHAKPKAKAAKKTAKRLKPSPKKTERKSQEIELFEEIIIPCANCGKQMRLFKAPEFNTEGMLCQSCTKGEIDLSRD